MSLKKIIRKVHLWLGLTTGPVVFVVAITGCIYVFQEEIQDLLYDYRRIEEGAVTKDRLSPSELLQIAKEQLPEKQVQRLYYNLDDRSSVVRFIGTDYYYMVYINPYSGAVLKIRDMYNDFFHTVFRLHVHLLLPPEIGKKIVSISTLLFLIILISGLYLWWPRKKGKAKSSFTVTLNARPRRKIYDLHNVLGFYIMWIGIFSACTGLVWGFEWFGNMTYFISSGKSKPDLSMPMSVAAPGSYSSNNLDLAYEKVAERYPSSRGYMIFLPQDEQASIGIAANPSSNTYYSMDYIYFDQHSLQELSRPVYGKFESASVADKILRANYDLHVGSIGGFPMQITLFLASLIIASLPITGFLLWIRYKKNKKNKDLNKKPVQNVLAKI